MSRSAVYIAFGIFALSATSLLFSIWWVSPILRLNDNCRNTRVDLGIPVAVPGCVGSRSAGGPSVAVHFNQFGFRDKEREDKKKPGTLRVALLGGSTALGFGLTDEQTVGWRVEEILHAEGVTGVEFMNLSMEGYEAVRHSLRIFEYLKRLHPDVVIVDTIRTDKIFTDFADWGAAVFDERGRPVYLHNLSDIVGVRLMDFLKSRTFFGHWLKQMYTGYRRLLAAISLHLAPADTQGPRLIKPAKVSLKIMNTACSMHDCELRVLWDPDENVSLDQSWIERGLFEYHLDFGALRESLERAGIGIFDVKDLKPRRTDEKLFQPGSRYYTAEGMNVYSKMLAGTVRRILSERAGKGRP